MNCETPRIVPRITPFLWYDGRAEEAANFYTSIFENSKVLEVSPMVVTFELSGMRFMALNGGPMFQFTEAISFYVNCETQEEVDYFWGKLSDGGTIQQCGWVKDRFGVSWQVIPSILGDLLGADDSEKARRAMDAMLQMVKLDIEALKAAFDGR
jgi:predicted 3-demethylubiquinone-9 3-methyltransferase (glyoxalase superfamily)